MILKDDVENTIKEKSNWNSWYKKKNHYWIKKLNWWVWESITLEEHISELEDQVEKSPNMEFFRGRGKRQKILNKI